MIEAEGLWPLVEARAEATPDALFAVDEQDRTLSFADYRDATLRCAAGLAHHGINAGGDADFKDVYMQLKNVPYIGNIKVGHFKEPFSMEELTSSKYITFLERALPNAFAPSRNTGIQLHDTLLDGRMTYAVGIFKDVNSYGDGHPTSGVSGLQPDLSDRL